MSSRQPKTGEHSIRAQVLLTKKQLRVIDKAAKERNLSRSNYMATVATAAAEAEIAKGKA